MPLESAARPLASIEQPAVWRPVQFLGSKLRSLDDIVTGIESVTDGPTSIWEPFAGSSVVSQRMAQSGNCVWACDALLSSSIYAGALLGVGRSEHQTTILHSLAVSINNRARGDDVAWRGWLAQESAALASCAGSTVLRTGEELPQRWRSNPVDRNLRTVFDRVDIAAAEGRTQFEGLISSTYAGTYFGIRQAIELERLREAIDSVTPTGDSATSWARSVFITALCHAASAAVFSAGKHFAQPHRIHLAKDLGFHGRRVLSDRTVDIPARFHEAVARIAARQQVTGEGHEATHVQASEVTATHLVDRNIRTVYADPPYTAQQYSRFYHVLEVLASGVPARLQQVRGRVTRGLYPEGKYLSPFSSRTKAPNAFRNLIANSHDAGASILLSYSGTQAGATGNARIVTMDELYSWVSKRYGNINVSVERLDLTYRQFNHTALGVAGRNDPEFLIIGRSGAR